MVCIVQPISSCYEDNIPIVFRSYLRSHHHARPVRLVMLSIMTSIYLTWGAPAPPADTFTIAEAFRAPLMSAPSFPSHRTSSPTSRSSLTLSALSNAGQSAPEAVGLAASNAHHWAASPPSSCPAFVPSPRFSLPPQLQRSPAPLVPSHQRSSRPSVCRHHPRPHPHAAARRGRDLHLRRHPWGLRRGSHRGLHPPRTPTHGGG